MLIPAVLLLVLGFVLHEERVVQKWHNTQVRQFCFDISVLVSSFD